MATETLVSCDQALALSIAERSLADTVSQTKAGGELQRVISAEFLAGIQRVAARRLQLTISWPDGVPADARATLRAQLQAELNLMAGAVVAAQAVEIPRTAGNAMRAVVARTGTDRPD